MAGEVSKAEDSRRHYERNRDAVIARSKEWVARNRGRQYRNAARSREKLLREVLEHYGSACACCGEDNPRFLTVDHCDGTTEPKLTGHRLRAWMRQHGFPPGFQILCWNCNCGRAFNGGVCPHEAAA